MPLYREQLERHPLFRALPEQLRQKFLADHAEELETSDVIAQSRAESREPEGHQWVDELDPEQRRKIAERLEAGRVTANQVPFGPERNRRELDYAKLYAVKQGNLTWDDKVGTYRPTTKVPEERRPSALRGLAHLAGLTASNIRDVPRILGEGVTRKVEGGLEAVGVPEGAVRENIAGLAGGGVEYGTLLAAIPKPFELAKNAAGAPAALRALAAPSSLRPLLTGAGLKAAAARTGVAAATGAVAEPTIGTAERVGRGVPTSGADLAEDVLGGAGGFAMGHGLVGELAVPAARGLGRGAVAALRRMRGDARVAGAGGEVGRAGTPGERGEAPVTPLEREARAQLERAEQRRATDPDLADREAKVAQAVLQQAERARNPNAPRPIGSADDLAARQQLLDPKYATAPPEGPVVPPRRVGEMLQGEIPDPRFRQPIPGEPTPVGPVPGAPRGELPEQAAAAAADWQARQAAAQPPPGGPVVGSRPATVMPDTAAMRGLQRLKAERDIRSLGRKPLDASRALQPLGERGLVAPEGREPLMLPPRAYEPPQLPGMVGEPVRPYEVTIDSMGEPGPAGPAAPVPGPKAPVPGPARPTIRPTLDTRPQAPGLELTQETPVVRAPEPILPKPTEKAPGPTPASPPPFDPDAFVEAQRVRYERLGQLKGKKNATERKKLKAEYEREYDRADREGDFDVTDLRSEVEAIGAPGPKPKSDLEVLVESLPAGRARIREAQEGMDDAQLTEWLRDLLSDTRSDRGGVTIKGLASPVEGQPPTVRAEWGTGFRSTTGPALLREARERFGIPERDEWTGYFDDLDRKLGEFENAQAERLRQIRTLENDPYGAKEKPVTTEESRRLREEYEREYEQFGHDMDAADIRDAVEDRVSNELMRERVKGDEKPVPKSERKTPPAGRGVKQDADLSLPRHYGKEDVVGAHNAPDAKGRYVLVEAEGMKPSHIWNGGIVVENAAYPQMQFQPRDRTAKAAQLKVREDASRLDVSKLMDNPLGEYGRPIIDGEGHVLSGNGRWLSITHAYNAALETAAQYRAEIKRRAADFGIDPAAVDAMKRPILAFEIGEYPMEQRQAWTKAWNPQGAVARLTATETSMQDVARLTPDVLDQLQETGPGTYNPFSSKNREFVEAWLQRVESGERGRLITDKGLSVDGQTRLENALFARAYHTNHPGHSDLLKRAMETDDDAVKGMLNVLRRVAPNMARYRAAAEAGSRYDYDLAVPLNEALGTVATLRQRKEKLSSYLRTADAFRDPATTFLLEQIAGAGRSPARLEPGLRRFVELVDELGDPRQASIFDKKPAPSRNALLEKAFAEAKGDEQAALDLDSVGAQHTHADYKPHEMKPSPVRDQIDRYKAAEDKYLKELAAAEGAKDADGVAKAQTALGAVRDILSRLMADEQGSMPGTGLDYRVPIRRQSVRSMVGAISQGPSAFFRKYPEARRIVERVQRSIDDGQRIMRQMLERAGIEGKLGTGGLRPMWQALDPKKRRPVVDALDAADAAGKRPTDLELEDAGLDLDQIATFRGIEKLLRDALEKFINPARVRLGLEPLDGRGFYLPHRWFGHFEIYRKGVDLPLEDASRRNTFLTAHEAKVAAKEMVTADPSLQGQLEIVPRYREIVNELDESAGARALDGLLRYIEEQGRKDLAAQVRDIEQNRRSAVSFSRHYEQRQGAPGYERERIMEAVDMYLREMSHYIPRKLASAEIYGHGPFAKSGMLSAALQAIKDPTVVDQLQRFLDHALHGKVGAIEASIDRMLRHLPEVPGLNVSPSDYFSPHRPTARALGAARATVFHSKLGTANWSFLPVQMAQNLTHGAAITGLGNMRRGYLRYIAPDKADATFLGVLEKEGVLTPRFVHGEIAGTGGLGEIRQGYGLVPGGAAARRWLADVSSYFANQGEQSNRGALAFAVLERLRSVDPANPGADAMVRFAYDTAKPTVPTFDPKTRTSVDKPFDVSHRAHQLDLIRRVNDRVHFRYDAIDRPPMMRGALGQTFFQFKQYVTATIDMERRFLDLARNAPDDYGPRTVRPLFQHLATMGLLAGVTGMPMALATDKMVEYVTGWSPLDYALQKLPAPIYRGIPALVGIDISRRVGQGDFVPTRAGDALPPVVSTAWRASQDLAQFGPDEALQNMVPTYRTIRRVMEKHNGQVRDQRGRLMYTPDWWDTYVVTPSGFQSVREAELFQRQRIARKGTEQRNELRGAALDELAAELRPGGSRDRENVRQIIRRLRDSGQSITGSDVRRRIRDAQRTAAQRLERATPRDMRRSLRTLMENERLREQQAREYQRKR